MNKLLIKIYKLKQFNYLKTVSGFSLVELLVVAGISTIVMGGTLKILSISLQSSRIARSTMVEVDLLTVIRESLQPKLCKFNFKEGGIDSTVAGASIQIERLHSRNEPDGSPLLALEIGKDFKNSITIVDMKLKVKQAATPPANSAKLLEFIVYYEKVGMGKLNTLGGGNCTATTLAGCYFTRCTLNYKKSAASGENTVDYGIQTCNLIDCGGVGGSDDIACITLDNTDLDTDDKIGRSLVGCGGTNAITKKRTVAFGYGAGAGPTTTGADNTLGADNTFIGYKSGGSNTVGEYNTFIGHLSGFNNTRIPIPFTRTGNDDHRGNYNTFLGFESGKSNTIGFSNTFLGVAAGHDNIAGANNTFVGYRAGQGNTEGTENTFIGTSAGFKNKAVQNTFIGSATGKHNTRGNENTFIGYKAGFKNTGGTENTFVGTQAGLKNEESHNNTFLGFHAGEENISGTNNTLVGHRAGHHNLGNYNTFVGTQTGHNTIGTKNTFVGFQAGASVVTTTRVSDQTEILDLNVSQPPKSGNENTFIGYKAGFKNNASFNTFLGVAAGEENTSGTNNTFVGYYAGEANDAGNENTFIGYKAGFKNNNASYNTFLGFAAGHEHTTGAENTFLGTKAGRNHTTGNYNTFVGFQAGGGEMNNENPPRIISTTTGANNTFIGYNAGQKNQGNYNTFLGFEAGKTLNNPSNSIIIKAGTTERKANPTTTNWVKRLKNKNDKLFGNNNILIGSFSVEKEKQIMSKNSNYLWIQDLIEGNSQEKWVSIQDNLETKNLYAALQSSSDKRLKKEIKKVENILKKINKLKPYSFKWKDNTTTGDHFGFIAQEVKPNIPEVVKVDRKGFLTINYPELIPLIVGAFKEFQQLIAKELQSIKNNIKEFTELKGKFNAFVINNTKKLTELKTNFNTFVINNTKKITELKTNFNAFVKSNSKEIQDIKTIQKQNKKQIEDILKSIKKDKNNNQKVTNQIKIELQKTKSQLQTKNKELQSVKKQLLTLQQSVKQ